MSLPTQDLKDLHITANRIEPLVCFEAATGEFLMEGTCRPENAREYFQPLNDWINDFLSYHENSHSKKPYRFVFRLEYLNSISIKIIYDLLRKVEKADNHLIRLEWHYLAEDIDMKEVGEEYARLLKIPIQLVSEKV